MSSAVPPTSSKPAGPPPGGAHPTPPISRGGARAAILSRLAAQGRSPDFLDEGAIGMLIDHAHGSPRTLRLAVDSTLALAARENAANGDAALVGRALGVKSASPGVVVPARTRRALWLAGAGFAIVSVLLIWVVAPMPARVAMAPAALPQPTARVEPAELARVPDVHQASPPAPEPATPDSTPPDSAPPGSARPASAPPDTAPASAATVQPSSPPPDALTVPGPTEPQPAAATAAQSAASAPAAPENPPATPPEPPAQASLSPGSTGSLEPTGHVDAAPPGPASAAAIQPPASLPTQASLPPPASSPPVTTPPPALALVEQPPASTPAAQPTAQPQSPAQSSQSQPATALPQLAPAVGVATPPVPAAPIAAEPPTALILYAAGAPGVQQRLSNLSTRLRQAGIGQVERRAVPAGTALGRPVSYFDNHDLALAQRAAGVLASEGWPNLPVDELAPRIIRSRAALRQKHVVIEIQLP